METNTAKCHSCGNEYEFYNSGNMMIFCPHCHHCDNVCCDFGFGPVTPCSIDMGTERLGVITIEKNGREERYKLVSEKYGIDTFLKSSYMEAIGEAGRMISDMIEKG